MNKILKAELLGIIAIIVAAILWGLDGIALTPNLYKLNVPFVVFMLHFIPAILLTFIFGRYWKIIPKLEVKTLFSLIVVSIFGGALGTIAIVKSLFLVNFDHLSVVVILQKLQPIFAVILARIFLGEKTSRTFWIWGALALVGGYFLTFENNIPNFSADNNLLTASLYALLAAFSFGAGTVFSKKSLASLNFKEVTYFRYCFTAIIMGIFMGFNSVFAHVKAVDMTQWLYILLISLTTGSGAILLYYYGLKRVKATASAFAELFFPISSVVFDYYINGHSLSKIQLISASVMVFAILMINRKK